jgi:hypothetical protein
MKSSMMGIILVLGIVQGISGMEQEYHKTSEAVEYKCLFNHELLIIGGPKENSPRYIKSYITKLAGTDVDVVMCCPTSWRTNVFPSEVDLQWKKYKEGQVSKKYRPFDYIMKYIHGGGDPVAETLAECRKCDIDFFISYRMNDPHYITDVTWPTHNFIWRDFPEYWLGDSNTSPYARDNDDCRLHNYMVPEVRQYYFAIIEELCNRYDVDGVELDFQRFPKYFRSTELEKGTEVMTGFVRKIRKMLDKVGEQRGKSLKLCVRVPKTIADCRQVGLDVVGWDAQGLVDMINVSSFYVLSLNLGIEEFQARTKRAKIYGEMHYIIHKVRMPRERDGLRYTNFETYRGTALNFFHRGADGICMFNYDYVPSDVRFSGMAEGLKGITDVEYLKGVSKNYVEYASRDRVYSAGSPLPAKDEVQVDVVIPDNTSAMRFDKAVLRVETKNSCEDQEIGVWLNETGLKECTLEGVELFPPVQVTKKGYAQREAVKFFMVPLEKIVVGKNEVKIRNLDKSKGVCEFMSLEIGLYR